VSVDLIGPWTIKVHGVDLQFLALTAVDTVMTIAEVICIDDKTSAHVAMKFENEWYLVILVRFVASMIKDLSSIHFHFNMC
jgi:hypothetical protein